MLMQVFVYCRYKRTNSEKRIRGVTLYITTVISRYSCLRCWWTADRVFQAFVMCFIVKK